MKYKPDDKLWLAFLCGYLARAGCWRDDDKIDKPILEEILDGKGYNIESIKDQFQNWHKLFYEDWPYWGAALEYAMSNKLLDS